MSSHSQSTLLRSLRPIESSTGQRAKFAGKRLGKFQILGELGRGGMGVVFEARDTVLERKVAIKLLPRSVASRPESLERFLREARAAAKLNHPHVVAVYDADQHNGQYYIVLELVRGGSLQEVLKTGPLLWDEASRVLADACRGLEVAHRAGLVHRDIKPSNLMRSEDGTVKLSDFGLARPNEPTGTTMTGSDSVLGTPQYMSPEQCRSERADERSDLYAMGATYFALLTGRPPYPGDAPLLVMNAHLLDPIPDPRDVVARIPEACSAIIRRAMAKDPDDRYASAAELLAELRGLFANGETDVGDTSVWPTRQPHAAAASDMSADTTEPGSLIGKLNRKLTPSPRRVRRPFKLFAVSAVMAVAISVGWYLRPKTSRSDSSTAHTALPVGNVGSKPTAAILPVTTRPKLDRPQARAIAVDRETFRLPGMVRDPQLSNAQHNVWSMESANLSRVYLANSGEFLVVLTNVPLLTGKKWRGQVDVWNRDGAKLLSEEISGRATSAAISANSTRLAIGTTGGQGVLLWDTRSWDIKDSAVSSTSDRVESVALSPDGKWLAYTTMKSSQDGEWVLWDIAAQKEQQRRVVSGSGNLRAIEFASNDDLLVATGGRDGFVRHWRGTQAELVPQTFNVGQPVYAIAFQPGGNLQATGFGKEFSLWDNQRNVQTFVRRELPVLVDDVAFSPDGQFACVSSGAMVEIFDAETGRVVETLTGFGGRVLSMAFTPDGTELFAASASGRLTVWQLMSHPATAAR